MHANSPEWMLYGANGYTGALLAEEAVRRGHRPLLAGRSAAKLEPLAQRLNLEYAVLPLDDEAALLKTLKNQRLVLHAAGPFVQTSLPMARACLRSRVHYLDITGEIPVFEANFALDSLARQAGVLLLSGAGFDVVPSDCLAVFAAQQLPGAVELELGVAALSQASAGTAQTMLELIPGGGLVRRAGRLERIRLGQGARALPFKDKARLALPIPWGDLSTAFRSTRIENITTYMTFPPALIRRMGWLTPFGEGLLRIGALRRLVQAWVRRSVRGPDETARQTRRAQLYARVSNGLGRAVEAWLETPEAYQLTVLAGIRIVEQVLARGGQGARSPAQFLGADFILEIPGVTRW